ncbi:hypothetical protein JGU66_10580 [Myxococcaceae bacterium JPH2]|nr:hypothetical protein [Myxococcaceae bacterium JPH2]
MSEQSPDDAVLDGAALARLRAAFQSGEGVVPTSEEAERIWLVVTGASTPAQRAEVLERVAADPSWAQAWRLAHALSVAAASATPMDSALGERTAARAREPGAREGRTRFVMRRPLWSAMAAMLVVGLAGLWVTRVDEGSGTYRGAETATVVSELSEGAVLARADCVLRWRGGPEGTRWSVRFSSEDLRVVHRVERLERNVYRVPAEVLAPLPSGARVFWQVEAHLPDGRVWRGATFMNRLD